MDHKEPRYGFVDFIFGMGCLAKSNNNESCSNLKKCNSFEKLKELFIYFLPLSGEDREAIVQNFLSSPTEDLYYSLIEIGTINQEKVKMVIDELIKRPGISTEIKKDLEEMPDLCRFLSTLDH